MENISDSHPSDMPHLLKVQRHANATESYAVISVRCNIPAHRRLLTRSTGVPAGVARWVRELESPGSEISEQNGTGDAG